MYEHSQEGEKRHRMAAIETSCGKETEAKIRPSCEKEHVRIHKAMMSISMTATAFPAASQQLGAYAHFLSHPKEEQIDLRTNSKYHPCLVFPFQPPLKHLALLRLVSTRRSLVLRHANSNSSHVFDTCVSLHVLHQ